MVTCCTPARGATCARYHKDLIMHLRTQYLWMPLGLMALLAAGGCSGRAVGLEKAGAIAVEHPHLRNFTVPWTKVTQMDDGTSRISGAVARRGTYHGPSLSRLSITVIDAEGHETFSDTVALSPPRIPIRSARRSLFACDVPFAIAVGSTVHISLPPSSTPKQ